MTITLQVLSMLKKTLQMHVSIADSDIDDSPSDLEEDSSTREAYAKLYRMADG